MAPVTLGRLRRTVRMSAERWASVCREAAGIECKPLVGVGTLLGIAWVLVAFSTAQAIGTNAAVYAGTIDLVVLTVFAVVLFAGGFGVIVHGLFDRAFLIAKWTLLGILGVMGAIMLNVLALDVVAFDFTVTFFMLVNAAIGGSVLGFLVGIYDAGQKRLTEQLNEEQKRATEFSQRLSVINRVLRHDIRHQTQLIGGHLERLEADERTGAKTTIQQANERLVELSDQARHLQKALSRHGSGTESVDLVNIVAAACDDLEAEYPAVDLQRTFPASAMVQGSTVLREAVDQLLANAVEHNEGPPHVQVTIERRPENPHPVTLVIRDDGPGIPDVEPIRQEDPIETSLDHSNGFGLWFATWVVEDVGGQLTIETPEEASSGTVVTMSLPAAEAK